MASETNDNQVRNKGMYEFSIIICAYNAADRIRKTLEHIAKLDYSTEHLELILVDNNSNDGTALVAEEAWGSLNSAITFHIVKELNQGLSYARKRGVIEALGEFIVFCDDDNWLDSQYLKIAREVLKNNPAIGVLGGQGIPITEADCFPNWFFIYAGYYATGVQSIRSGDISARGYVWGSASIVCRKPLMTILTSGLDFLLSDRKGDSLSSGGDDELCKWFLIAGYKLWYIENMLFQHFIPSRRLTIDYIEKLLNSSEHSQSGNVVRVYDRYINRRDMRNKWYKYPKLWFMSELRLLLDNTPIKRKVVNIAKSIERLALHTVNRCF